MGGGGARRFKFNFECMSFHAILVLHKNASASSSTCVPGRRSRRSKGPKRHKLIFHLVFFSLFLSLPLDLTKQSGVKAGKGGRKRWLSWRKVGMGRRERVATDARSGDEGFGGGVWPEVE